MKNRRTRRQRLKAKRAKLRKDRGGAPDFELVTVDGVRYARRPEKPRRYLLPGDE